LAMAVLILALYFAWNVSGQREMRLSTALASVAPRLAGFEPAVFEPLADAWRKVGLPEA